MRELDRNILSLALPSIIQNITVPLLGLVDLTIVGHFGSAKAMGAIAVGSMIFNVIYWLLGFLRMGTSGLTSQAYGRRDVEDARRLLRRVLSIASTSTSVSGAPLPCSASMVSMGGSSACRIRAHRSTWQLRRTC